MTEDIEKGKFGKLSTGDLDRPESAAVTNKYSHPTPQRNTDKRNMSDEIEKAKHGPDKPEPIKPREHKVGSMKYTEEPATKPAFHQNYKSYPNRADFGKGEAVTEDDMRTLSKSLSTLTQVIKDMTESLEKAKVHKKPTTHNSGRDGTMATRWSDRSTEYFHSPKAKSKEG